MLKTLVYIEAGSAAFTALLIVLTLILMQQKTFQLCQNYQDDFLSFKDSRNQTVYTQADLKSEGRVREWLRERYKAPSYEYQTNLDNVMECSVRYLAGQALDMYDSVTIFTPHNTTQSMTNAILGLSDEIDRTCQKSVWEMHVHYEDWGETWQGLDVPIKSQYKFNLTWAILWVLGISFTFQAFRARFIATRNFNPYGPDLSRWTEYMLTSGVQIALVLTQLNVYDWSLLVALVFCQIALVSMGYYLELVQHNINRDERFSKLSVLKWESSRTALPAPTLTNPQSAQSYPAFTPAPEEPLPEYAPPPPPPFGPSSAKPTAAITWQTHNRDFIRITGGRCALDYNRSEAGTSQADNSIDATKEILQTFFDVKQPCYSGRALESSRWVFHWVLFFTMCLHSVIWIIIFTRLDKLRTSIYDCNNATKIPELVYGIILTQFAVFTSFAVVPTYAYWFWFKFEDIRVTQDLESWVQYNTMFSKTEQRAWYNCAKVYAILSVTSKSILDILLLSYWLTK